MIFVFSLVFLFMVRRVYRKRSDKFPKLNERKTVTTSLLLLLFFVFFNAVPDAIMFFKPTPHVYLVVSFLWSTGCVADPIIYIFINKKTANIAKRTLKRVFCLTQADGERENSPLAYCGSNVSHKTSVTSAAACEERRAQWQQQTTLTSLARSCSGESSCSTTTAVTAITAARFYRQQSSYVCTRLLEDVAV